MYPFTRTNTARGGSYWVFMAGKSLFPTQVTFLDSLPDLHHKRGETDKRQIAVSEQRGLGGMGFLWGASPPKKELPLPVLILLCNS